MRALSLDLVSRGYAAYNLEYRRLGASGGGFPETFVDVAAGIDFLGSRKPCGVDLSRWVAFERSALYIERQTIGSVLILGFLPCKYIKTQVTTSSSATGTALIGYAHCKLPCTLVPPIQLQSLDLCGLDTDHKVGFCCLSLEMIPVSHKPGLR